MFCGSCGASVAPDGKFCGRCGTPVGAAPAPAAVEPDVSEMTIMRPSHAMTPPPVEATPAYEPPAPASYEAPAAYEAPVAAPSAPIAPTAPVAPAAPQATATPAASPAYGAPSAPAAYSAPRAASPVAFNVGSLGTLDFVGLGAGLLFFIFSFLNGFIHISANGGSIGGYSYSGGSETNGTAWHSWGWLGTLIVLAAVALLVTKAFDGLIPKTVPLPLITAVAAGAGWLLLMIRSWTYDAGYSGISVSPGWSAWVMMVLGLVLIGVTVFPLINGQNGAASHGYGASAPPAYQQPQAYPQPYQQPQSSTDYPQPPGQYPPPPA